MTDLTKRLEEMEGIADAAMGGWPDECDAFYERFYPHTVKALLRIAKAALIANNADNDLNTVWDAEDELAHALIALEALHTEGESD